MISEQMYSFLKWIANLQHYQCSLIPKQIIQLVVFSDSNTYHAISIE